MPPSPAASRRAPQLSPAASSRKPPALQAKAWPAPLGSLSVLIGRHGVRHFAIPLENLLIGVALGRIALFVSLIRILVLFLELFITK